MPIVDVDFDGVRDEGESGLVLERGENVRHARRLPDKAQRPVPGAVTLAPGIGEK